MKTKKPIHLPPYTVKKVMATLSQTIDWGLKQLNVPDTWKITQGENITVMVIDTGMPDHHDLNEAILADKCKNFTDNKTKYDGNSHSTFCSGIIGARNNGIGIVGVAPKCNIITCKALGDDGSGAYEWINNALKYAIELKPDIVSMSLGGPQDDKTMHNLIKELTDMNIPVIVAAGNEGGANQKKNMVGYPGKYEEAIAVAAYDKYGDIANFSSYGEEVDIAGPGVDIYSTYLNNGYAIESGTSFSCPFVAGVVALLLAKHRKQELETGKNDCYTVAQIKEHLYKYANDKGVIGKDPSWGVGIVDPNRSLLETAENVKPPVKEKKKWWQKVLDFLFY